MLAKDVHWIFKSDFHFFYALTSIPKKICGNRRHLNHFNWGELWGKIKNSHHVTLKMIWKIIVDFETWNWCFHFFLIWVGKASKIFKVLCIIDYSISPCTSKCIVLCIFAEWCTSNDVRVKIHNGFIVLCQSHLAIVWNMNAASRTIFLDSKFVEMEKCNGNKCEWLHCV